MRLYKLKDRRKLLSLASTPQTLPVLSKSRSSIDEYLCLSTVSTQTGHFNEETTLRVEPTENPCDSAETLRRDVAAIQTTRRSQSNTSSDEHDVRTKNDCKVQDFDVTVQVPADPRFCWWKSASKTLVRKQYSQKF